VRIDAHQHFWRFDPVRDAWITLGMSVIRRDFLPADLMPLLAVSGIDGVVAVQADQSAAETEFLLGLSARHAFVKGVVGWIDLRASDLTRQLAEWSGHARLKGFRHIAQGEPDNFLMHDDVVRGVTTIGRLGYSYDILIYPRQLAAAERLVARCPDVRFILDHCAKPPIASGDLTTWRTGFVALAAHENVFCKLSGLVTEASWSSWSDAQLAPALDTALESFGAKRLMFGSDWPVCLLAADYPRVVDSLHQWAARLSETEQSCIFGGTAISAYQLEA
jgi:L-fuconolactonase